MAKVKSYREELLVLTERISELSKQCRAIISVEREHCNTLESDQLRRVFDELLDAEIAMTRYAK